MDDEFVIRAVDDAGEEVVRFDGLAGLEDHQDGKMDIFDEAFELTSLRVDPGPVTARTRAACGRSAGANLVRREAKSASPTCRTSGSSAATRPADGR